MNKRLILFVMIVLLLLAGCAPASRSTASEAAPEAPAMDAPGAPPMEMEESFRGADVQDSAGGETGQVDTNAERLVIRNANLTIVVADPGQAMSTVTRMASEMGGYVVSSNLYKASQNNIEYPEANITVRVPAARLNDAMDQIKGLVEDPDNDVRSENVTGQDVTKEYTDLNSRLRNLEETEAQLREIMGSATKTEDVLAVHNQLTYIREQIEVIKGQIQYYKEAAALSSIAIVIQARAAVQPIEVGGWQPEGVARDAVQSLINALQGLGSIVIWLFLFFLPVALVLALPIAILWLIIRRVRKNRKVSAPVEPAA